MNDATKKIIMLVMQDLADGVIKNSNSETLKFECDFNEFFLTYDKLNLLAKKEVVGQDTQRIDRHKIAACIALSVLILKPIKNMDTTLTGQRNLYYLCNEVLAIFLSIYTLKMFVIKEDSIKDPIKYSIKDKGFVFPENPGNNYVLWLASSLSKVNKINDVVYLSLLSNIFFLLENYTIEKYINEPNPE